MAGQLNWWQGCSTGGQTAKQRNRCEVAQCVFSYFTIFSSTCRHNFGRTVVSKSSIGKLYICAGVR